nr:hypothetical protein [Deltaproteobacteria bacterium]
GVWFAVRAAVATATGTSSDGTSSDATNSDGEPRNATTWTSQRSLGSAHCVEDAILVALRRRLEGTRARLVDAYGR